MSVANVIVLVKPLYIIINKISSFDVRITCMYVCNIHMYVL